MYKTLFDPDAACLIFAPDDADPRPLLSGANNVFVCGGLQNPEKMKSILGREAAFAPAAVSGFMRTTETIDGKGIPFMAPCDDATAILTGVLWLDLSDEDVSKIEGFELAGNYRKRITLDVQVGERSMKAITYVKSQG